MATVSEAKALGFITPAPTDLVTNGDDAIRQNALATVDLYNKNGEGTKTAIEDAMVGVLRPRGPAPTGADFNAYAGPDYAGVWELKAGAQYRNAPFDAAGQLIVSGAGASTRQSAIRHGMMEVWTRQTSSTSAWFAWAGTDVQQPPAGVNLDNLRSNVELVIRNTTDAVAITGGWPDELGIPRVAAHVTVRVTTTGLVFQQLHTYGADPRLLIRSTRTTQTSPYPFSPWVDATAPGVSEARVREIAANTAAPSQESPGLANAVLLQDFTRRRPVVPTGGLPAVALRFDHGLANFRDLVRPTLNRLGLPAAICLNAGDWTRRENGTVTAADVNTWVTNGEIEVWNHALNHTDVTDPAEFETQIIGGLDKLRADLPAATIDGFMPPGSGPYIDFDGGDTPESWFETVAGRTILRSHAVATGYLPGSAYRPLDGQPRHGLGHWTLDTMTRADAQTRIAAAYKPVRGVQVMLHPSRLDTAGYMTSKDFTALLEWIAAERDAGRLLVLGAYDLLRAVSSK